MDQTPNSLPFMDGDLAVTVFPGREHVSEHLAKFRWNMQVALPYPFPSRICLVRDICVEGLPYSFQIHNHFNRISQILRDPSTGATWPRSFMHDKRMPLPKQPDECVGVNTQSLQSVVFFDGRTDYPTATEAWAKSHERMQACQDYLASFLAACQRDAPYMSAWLIYPISLFEVGSVHCEIRGFCTKHDAWHLLDSGMQSSLGRQLQQPIFFMNIPDAAESVSPLDVANELLAEALMASYRGMPRLTVINSYTALESFANSVFAQMQTARLISNGVDKEYAESVVEDHRSRHRNDASFLYHSGIKTASGKSLKEENEYLYDAVMRTREIRHKVAHTGHKPSLNEAREVHRFCCEAVQWLTAVAGLPVKPLRPAPEDSSNGFVANLGTICGQASSTVSFQANEIGTPSNNK